MIFLIISCFFLWKFPYLTGENGGGAFVLFYFFFLLILGMMLVLLLLMVVLAVHSVTLSGAGEGLCFYLKPDFFMEEANIGKGLKVKKWMKPYMQYVLPIIIFVVLLVGLFTFNYK